MNVHYSRFAGLWTAEEENNSEFAKCLNSAQRIFVSYSIDYFYVEDETELNNIPIYWIIHLPTRGAYG